jgi:hypothetical protein
VQFPTGHEKPLPGFGSGDKVGFLVTRTSAEDGNPDSLPEFRVDLFLNGEAQGFLVKNLKVPAVWPFATLSPQEVETSQPTPSKSCSEGPRLASWLPLCTCLCHACACACACEAMPVFYVLTYLLAHHLKTTFIPL